MLSKGSVAVSPNGRGVTNEQVVTGGLMRHRVARSSAALSLPKTTRRSQQMRNLNINDMRARQSLTTLSPQAGTAATTMAPATATTMDSAIATTADASATTTTPIETVATTDNTTLAATNPGDESGTGANPIVFVIVIGLLSTSAVATAYLVFKYMLRQAPRGSDTARDDKAPLAMGRTPSTPMSRTGSNTLHPSQTPLSRMARAPAAARERVNTTNPSRGRPDTKDEDSGEGEPVVTMRSLSQGSRPRVRSASPKGGSSPAKVSFHLSRGGSDGSVGASASPSPSKQSESSALQQKN